MSSCDCERKEEKKVEVKKVRHCYWWVKVILRDYNVGDEVLQILNPDDQKLPVSGQFVFLFPSEGLKDQFIVALIFKHIVAILVKEERVQELLDRNLEEISDNVEESTVGLAYGTTEKFIRNLQETHLSAKQIIKYEYGFAPVRETIFE